MSRRSGERRPRTLPRAQSWPHSGQRARPAAPWLGYPHFAQNWSVPRRRREPPQSRAPPAPPRNGDSPIAAGSGPKSTPMMAKPPNTTMTTPTKKTRSQRGGDRLGFSRAAKRASTGRTMRMNATTRAIATIASPAEGRSPSRSCTPVPDPAPLGSRHQRTTARVAANARPLPTEKLDHVVDVSLPLQFNDRRIARSRRIGIAVNIGRHVAAVIFTWPEPPACTPTPPPPPSRPASPRSSRAGSRRPASS
jgi:hypothetical protein